MKDKDRHPNEYISNITEVFETNPNWGLEDSYQNKEDILNSVAENDSVEFSYEHEDTSGSIHLRFRNDQEAVPVSGNLAQSIDPDVPHDPNPGFLSDELVKAYQSITSETESQYITTTENTYDVMFLNIPWDFDQGELEDAVDEASHVSEQVQEMYENVTNEIRQYQVEEQR